MSDGGNGASSTIRPAGRQVNLYNDQIFCELRAYAQVPDDFVNGGWNFEKDFAGGGGKGGTLMARVGDAYIVKELSPGDHKALLQITSSYAQHIRAGDTLLCPMYLHFQDTASKRFFFVMRNSIGRGPFKALYDLKGCADDKLLAKEGETIPAVHKRIWNVGMWCGTSGWTPARHRYYNGKVEARSAQIAMTKEQRDSFLQALQRDTSWLASHQLMDYSLLVAIKEETKDTATASGGLGPSNLGVRPFVRKGPQGEEISVFASIIDILQLWTTGKKVARVLKVMEQNKATVPPKFYAERFAKHFAVHTLAVKAEEVLPSVGTKGPAPVAPPAGDVDIEGMPEERAHSRPLPTEYRNITQP